MTETSGASGGEVEASRGAGGQLAGGGARQRQGAEAWHASLLRNVRGFGGGGGGGGAGGGSTRGAAPSTDVSHSGCDGALFDFWLARKSLKDITS